ncbi:hypothetical protein BCR42DRAFT_401783 [Absidia repens]|uniref:Uncharacterized protein n=1 Tax=Absidia repens TaxID=90262 RepID=A0A1X2J4Q2_9FUNG|nr:hypothetical protein BCR42DRAFT_401783 [Absidia repens]
MASANDDTSTKVSNRNDIFNDDQDDQPTDMEASKRMEAMMSMVLVEEDAQEESAGDDQDETMDDDEEEFAFRLFSTDSVAKVSIKENDEETANALSQQIANQQQIDHDETDPTFLANVAQASISYDDIMRQSTWAYPALRLPKRVTHLPSSTPTSTSSKTVPPESSSSSSSSLSSIIPKDNNSTSTSTVDKPKRKSKKRRDYEKAVKEGRITPKVNMRDPRTPGGWPGYPGARDPCAIINDQPYRGNRGSGGSDGYKYKYQGPTSKNGYGGSSSSRGRGRGGFGGRGRGRGGAGGPSRFNKAVAV